MGQPTIRVASRRSRVNVCTTRSCWKSFWPKYAGQRAASPVGAIGALALLLDTVGLPEARAAINSALFAAFRTDRIDGVEARAGRTFEDAKVVAELVARR